MRDDKAPGTNWQISFDSYYDEQADKALSEKSIVGPRPYEDKSREAAPTPLYSMTLLQGGAAKRGAAAVGRIQMEFSDRA